MKTVYRACTVCKFHIIIIINKRTHGLKRFVNRTNILTSSWTMSAVYFVVHVLVGRGIVDAMYEECTRTICNLPAYLYGEVIFSTNSVLDRFIFIYRTPPRPAKIATHKISSHHSQSTAKHWPITTKLECVVALSYTGANTNCNRKPLRFPTAGTWQDLRILANVDKERVTFYGERIRTRLFVEIPRSNVRNAFVPKYFSLFLTVRRDKIQTDCTRKKNYRPIGNG